MQPEKPVGPAPTVLQSLRTIALSSWLNILLAFIPISWAMHFVFAGEKDTLIFVFAFLAIIPLAKLLAFATDELSMRVGQTLAGLLNATLIIALTKCELDIVQSSLIGSILSNLLLVLGMCFFAGGIKYQEQGFGLVSSQMNSSLLTISVIAVLLPAAFHFAVTDDPTNDETSDILSLSHETNIEHNLVYISYLVFQLWSHTALYSDEGEHTVKSSQYSGGRSPFKMDMLRRKEKVASPNPDEEAPIEMEEEEEETPQTSLPLCIALLVVVTVLVAVTAEFLVSSIDGLAETSGISKEFVGMILLPIVGNAAEHATAVMVSVKDKLNLSLGVAVGSSIQIALFVIPFSVVLAWIMGKPLTLLFDPYESVALFLSVLTVNYVVQDGKSNWLEGMILMCLYVILGVTFWFYPGVNTLEALNLTCT
ncbi:calcium/proton exchanger [Cylindrobasidium torrendii FP15055 ss-10]|uniref:Calcium/proton exchanger n=1 Tax=Cylindrobasidium torrendii FP15055 ss-10 TaxID=1314674 RepID=A0A0D7BQ57_9AGAR|nr:calcium/proton exchanger [Cylindrobasidium torrendii FP15055 ss-10]